MLVNPSDTIGPYQLAEQIGMDGQMNIFRAFHEGFGRYVDLGIIPHRSTKVENQSLSSAAAEWLRMKHPNIISPIDIGQQNGLLYLAFEHLPGGTLATSLLDARQRGIDVPLGQIFRVAQAIGKGLNHLHRSGHYHGTVCPRNIHLDIRGIPKLGGLDSIFLSDISQGSEEFADNMKAYWSPERTRGSKPDNLSDSYSLGVIIAEMLTGLTVKEAIKAVVKLPRSVKLIGRAAHIFPNGLGDCLQRASNEDPQLRFSTTIELANAVCDQIEALNGLAVEP